MTTYNELVTRIEQLLKAKQHPIVAISGFGGSGKSSLTNKLASHFNIKDSQVIKIDHLYGPNPNGPDIFDQSDWVLLEKILKDVQAGKKLQYQGKGFTGEAIHVDEPLPPLVLVEGIRLLQAKFMTYYDLSIWIDCPQDIAIQRAKARDRLQGESEENINRWDTDWGPKDKLYFERYRPDKLSSLIYIQE